MTTLRQIVGLTIPELYAALGDPLEVRPDESGGQAMLWLAPAPFRSPAVVMVQQGRATKVLASLAQPADPWTFWQEVKIGRVPDTQEPDGARGEWLTWRDLGGVDLVAHLSEGCVQDVALQLVGA